MRILLLEDCPDVRLVLKDMFESAGAEVTDLESPALYPHDYPLDFDLVVTDNQMPGMTGLEYTNHLRVKGYAGPIVMQSSDFGNLEERFLAAGGTKFFQKGNPSPLIEWVRKAIAG